MALEALGVISMPMLALLAARMMVVMVVARRTAALALVRTTHVVKIWFPRTLICPLVNNAYYRNEKPVIRCKITNLSS